LLDAGSVAASEHLEPPTFQARIEVEEQLAAPPDIGGKELGDHEQVVASDLGA
jgi:hypothetical protein